LEHTTDRCELRVPRRRTKCKANTDSKNKRKK
jgi:hypothetical protein